MVSSCFLLISPVSFPFDTWATGFLSGPWTYQVLPIFPVFSVWSPTPSPLFIWLWWSHPSSPKLNVTASRNPLMNPKIRLKYWFSWLYCSLRVCWMYSVLSHQTILLYGIHLANEIELQVKSIDFKSVLFTTTSYIPSAPLYLPPYIPSPLAISLYFFVYKMEWLMICTRCFCSTF